MSDREIIIQLLRKVEWRLRLNRLMNELAVGLSIALLFLIAVKVCDLFSPFKAITIALIVGASVLAYAGFAVSRIRIKGTMDQAANSADQKAGLHDEIKTALWFINHPRSSEWVEKQLQLAARKAIAIDTRQAYPGVVPRAFYTAAIMGLLFIGLNFVPLSLNHNWLLLQAAPAIRLTVAQQAALDSAAQRRTTATLNQTAVNDPARLEDIKRGLEEIATDLFQSDELKTLAEAMIDGQLDLAADEMRNLAGQMASDKQAAAQKTAQSFDKASNNSRPGLEALTKKMGDLAQALENKDAAAIQEAAQKVAEELESIEGESQPGETGDEKVAKGTQAPRGSNSSQVRQDGQSPQGKNNSVGTGTSQGTNSGEREAPPTLAAKLQLDVQLQQAGVKSSRNEPGSSVEEIEEASRRERSTLEYRNVSSDLSAAQKDALTRSRIPWEYRPLIRGYFQAIRPPVKK